MKKNLPKLLIFFYLIPWAISMLLVAADAAIDIFYYELASAPDFITELPYTLEYYFSTFIVFAVLGICAYYIFFEKAWKAAVFTGCSLLYIVWIPCSRFLLQDLLLQDHLYDVAMLNLFYDSKLSLQILLTNALLFLLAILSVRITYAWFLMKKPQNLAPIYSPKNPIGLSAWIFYIAAIVTSVILLITTGYFGGEIICYVLRFPCTLFAASKTAKWMNAAKKEI